jgi:hypothetical protein
LVELVWLKPGESYEIKPLGRKLTFLTSVGIHLKDSLKNGVPYDQEVDGYVFVNFQQNQTFDMTAGDSIKVKNHETSLDKIFHVMHHG